MAFTALPLSAGDYFLDATGAIDELYAVSERWTAVGLSTLDLSAPIAEEHWLSGQIGLA